MTGEKATMDAPQIYVERTLAIVKPDAIQKSEEIEDIILRSGFAILQVNSKILLKQNKVRIFSKKICFYLLNNLNNRFPMDRKDVFT